MMRIKKEGAAIIAALVCMSTAVVSAQTYGASPEDVQFMDALLKETEKFPSADEQVKAYMSSHKIDAKSLAEDKLATPANVQQYAAGSMEETPAVTLSSSYLEARGALVKAREAVLSAKREANDEPRKYLGETGAKIMDMLLEAYNAAFVVVHERVNRGRTNATAGFAIALVINGGGGANAAQSEEAKKLEGAVDNEKGARAQDASGAVSQDLDPGDAATGARVFATVLPERPLAALGQSYMNAARKDIGSIRPLMMEMSKQLQEAERLAEMMQRKSSEYNKAMDGAGGTDRDLAQMVKSAAAGLSAHLARIETASRDIDGFVNGRGGETMRRVVQCVEDVLTAAQMLQRNNVTDAEQLRLAQIAFDSNQRAAREAGPAARELRLLLAKLGRALPAKGDMIQPLAFKHMKAPESYNSGSGDAEGIQTAVRKELPKVAPTAREKTCTDGGC